MEVRRNQGLQLLVYGSVWNCHLFLWVNLAQALRFFKSQAASSLWGDELWERPGLCNCHVWSEYARCKVHWSWNCSFQAVAKVGNGTTLDLALETLWQNTITHIRQAMWYYVWWCLMHLHHKHEPFDQWMCTRRIEEVQRRWFAYGWWQRTFARFRTVFKRSAMRLSGTEKWCVTLPMCQTPENLFKGWKGWNFSFKVAAIAKYWHVSDIHVKP